MIVHLVRHGQSEWNESRRVQGQQDPPLTPLGLTQATAAADSLRHRPLTAVWSSDLTRARRTAEPIAAAHGLPVVVDARLREQCLGVLEGLPQQEALDRSSGFDWTDVDAAVCGGESLRAVYARLVAVLDPLCRGEAGAEIAVVSHGDAIRVARCVLAGLPVESVTYDGIPTGTVLTVPI
ncbi:MAG TPA: histidine phosphatase family protein [Mycobacteriales bacterium]|nr:histidine phosphatase family protein [Mycobacteriales bacterium]